MASKKVEKGKVMRKDGKSSKAKPKKANKAPEVKNSAGQKKEPDKAAERKAAFLERRNGDILVVRINSDVLTYLAQKGWERGSQGGAATIAREIIYTWYDEQVKKVKK